MGVMFVNGWTDAPNAIATAISTRVMGTRTAIIMATILNFLGALLLTMINSQVAETISKMVVFEGGASQPQIALAAALFSIVVWATGAWYFGIPTSESHALIAGITGAALAMGKLILIGCEALYDAIAEFSHFKNSKKLSDLIISVNKAEEDGDRMHRSVIKAIYQNEKDPITLIKWKEIFNAMETVLDDCEDVADLLDGLIIKNT